MGVQCAISLLAVSALTNNFSHVGLALLRPSSPRTTACGRFFATDADSIPPPPVAQRTTTSQTGDIATAVLDANPKSSLSGQTEESAALRAGDPVENPQNIAEASGLAPARVAPRNIPSTSPSSSSSPLPQIAQPCMYNQEANKFLLAMLAPVNLVL